MLGTAGEGQGAEANPHPEHSWLNVQGQTLPGHLAGHSSAQLGTPDRTATKSNGAATKPNSAVRHQFRATVQHFCERIGLDSRRPACWNGSCYMLSMTKTFPSWLLLALASSGCSAAESEPADTQEAEPEPEPEPVLIEPEPPVSEPEPVIVLEPIVEPSTPVALPWTVTREDLSGRLPEGTKLTGVTRDPLDGALYVLDPLVGIYRIDASQAALVFTVGSVVPESGAPVGEFSDLASMGAGRFALTVPNEGYILDVEAGTMWSHFCYLPNEPSPTSSSISLNLEAQGIAVFQQTDSLAYDILTGSIFAQPQTLGVDGSEAYGSELANFNETTGEPLGWLLIDAPVTRAGGLALTQDEVLLGQGNSLYVYFRGSPTPHQTQVLDIPEISGMHGGDFEDILAVSPYERVLYHLKRAAAEN